MFSKINGLKVVVAKKSYVKALNLAEKLGKYPNTAVLEEPDGKVTVTLFSDPIIVWDSNTGEVCVNPVEDLTDTAKRRINETLEGLGMNASVYVKDGKVLLSKEGSDAVELDKPCVVTAAVHVHSMSEKEVVVYDEESNNFQDRYTVVIGNDVYSMSDNAHRPDGVNMWVGTTDEIPLGDHLGKKKMFDELPDNIKEAIRIRMKGFEAVAAIDYSESSVDVDVRKPDGEIETVVLPREGLANVLGVDPESVEIVEINSWFDIKGDYTLLELNNMLTECYNKEPDSAYIFRALGKETQFSEIYRLIMNDLVTFHKDVSDSTDLGQKLAVNMSPVELAPFMSPAYEEIGEDAIRQGWVIDRVADIAVKIKEDTNE